MRAADEKLKINKLGPYLKVIMINYSIVDGRCQLLSTCTSNNRKLNIKYVLMRKCGLNRKDFVHKEGA